MGEQHGLDELQRRRDRRAALIALVADGKPPAEAEAMCEAEGLGSLLSNPTPYEIDGYEEPAWTLLMAFAWVAWGQSATHVRTYFPRYRQRLRVWKRIGKGHIPAAAEVPTAHQAVKMTRSEMHDDMAAALKWNTSRASLGWDQLTKAFRSGEVSAEGQLVNDLAAGMVDIPARNWRSLLLMDRTGALDDALCYADGAPVYFNVTVDKEQLLKAFPSRALGVAQADATPAATDHGTDAVLADISQPGEDAGKLVVPASEAVTITTSILPGDVAPAVRRPTIRLIIEAMWRRWEGLPPHVLKHDEMAPVVWAEARIKHPELTTTVPSRDSFDRAKAAIRLWLAAQE